MKLTVCAGLNAAGLVTVNVSVVVPPSAIVVGLNTLVKLDSSGSTPRQLGVTALVRFVSPPMFADVSVRFASGHVPVCSGTFVTSTVIVQLDALAVLPGTVRLVTVIVLLPGAADTDPAVHVPPTFGVGAT